MVEEGVGVSVCVCVLERERWWDFRELWERKRGRDKGR